MFAYDDYGYEANAWMRREKNQWQKRERSLGGLIKHHFHLAGTRKHFIYVCVLLWLDSRKNIHTHIKKKSTRVIYTMDKRRRCQNVSRNVRLARVK